MADRGYRRYGKPPIVVAQLEMEDPDPNLYPAVEDGDEAQEQGPEAEAEPEQSKRT